MKFNFRKRLATKNKVDKGTKVSMVKVMTEGLSTRSKTITPPAPEITKVSMVRIMAEVPSTRSHTITPPAPKITKNVQPPSPTCVKEQVQFDVRMADGEEKESESTAEWNARYSGLACNHSSADPSSKGDVLGNSNEATKRWKELRKIINIKMEDVHEKCLRHPAVQKLFSPYDLGEFAMAAVEKNRNEMDEMIGKIDKETIVVDPMNWLWDKEISDDESYDSPIMTCSDMKACLQPSEETFGEENDTTIVPSAIMTCSNINACLQPAEDSLGEEKDIVIIVTIPSPSD